MNGGTAMLAASAVTPAALLLWYFYERKDHAQPRWLVVTAFVLGMLLVLPAAFLENFVPSGNLDPISAGVIEESLKFAVLWWIVARRPAFCDAMDGIVYGATIGLGFATLENLGYVFDGGMSVAAARALTSIPCHAMLGAIMGAYVGLARFAPENGHRRLVLAALLLPVVLHVLYDEGAALSNIFIIAAVLAAEVMLCRRLMHRVRAYGQAPSLFARVTDAGTHHRGAGAWVKILGGALAALTGSLMLLYLGLELLELIGGQPADSTPGQLFTLSAIAAALTLGGFTLFAFGVHEPARASP